MTKTGKVYLVGAGPGALGLVTLRAKQLIEHADVLVYDYLVNVELLGWIKPGAELIYAGKSGAAHTLSQAEINGLLVHHAQLGHTVVRLKGGDPYVFGRGGEEAQELVAAGVAFETVPGVSSAIAAPSYAGIPVTHRDYTSMVTFITGHEDPTKLETALDWRQLAHLRGTRVFLMGVERIRAITARLLDECADPNTPVAVIRWGTTPRQETVEGTLATIADIVEARDFKAPAVIVIGDVVKLRRELNWFEALPLLGQRVVVTRTRPQASALTDRLRQLGADVLEIPTIRTVPEPWTPPQRAELSDLAARVDWLVFTSPNAVEFFFAQFVAQVNDLRRLGEIKIAAVGPATRQKISALHLAVDLEPEVFTARDLAQAFPAPLIQGKRFLLPQGNLADPALAEHLAAAGGKVTVWKIYRTEPETGDANGARARFLREGAHWITFTSSSTVENWRRLALHPAAGQPEPSAISMGPVTSETLRRLGLEIAAEAPVATVNSLVETLLLLQSK